jgi:hypothetical protein
MNWAGIFSYILLLSFPLAASATQALCKNLLAEEAAIHQWGSGSYTAQLRPRKNPTKDKSPFVFQVFDSEQIHRQLVNPKETAFPLLRLPLKTPNIKNVEFFNYSKQLVLQFEKEVFLYELGIKKEKYHHRIKASVLENAQIKAHDNRLYQYNSDSLLISLHPKDGKSKAVDPTSFRGAKAKEFHVSLARNKELKKVFSEDSHLFGISLIFRDSPILLLDFNAVNKSGKRERFLGFYDLSSNKFAMKSVEEIFVEKLDSMPGGEKLKDPNSTSFKVIFAEIPLVNTGRVEFSTKHMLELNASEIRIEALTHGYIPLIESLLQN